MNKNELQNFITNEFLPHVIGEELNDIEYNPMSCDFWENVDYNLPDDVSRELIYCKRENEYWIEITKYTYKGVEFMIQFICDYDSCAGIECYTLVKLVEKPVIVYEDI